MLNKVRRENKVRRHVDDSVGRLKSSLGLVANGCFHLAMRPQLHILLRQPVTLPPKNVPLAECFNSSKENVNDKDDESAPHAGVQA
jgi:hypothetical protein